MESGPHKFFYWPNIQQNIDLNLKWKVQVPWSFRPRCRNLTAMIEFMESTFRTVMLQHSNNCMAWPTMILVVAPTPYWPAAWSNPPMADWTFSSKFGWGHPTQLTFSWVQCGTNLDASSIFTFHSKTTTSDNDPPIRYKGSKFPGITLSTRNLSLQMLLDIKV